nr:PREDICTED: xaa-Pro aminopeptidase 1-like isoform X1 [Bemisia tabaci]
MISFLPHLCLILVVGSNMTKAVVSNHCSLKSNYTMPARNTGTLLKSLRELMRNNQYFNETLAAYVIPSSDAHQSEYLADQDKRREFISGFTGSAGTAVVTENEALLWTDARYHVQAEQELDNNWTLMKSGLPSTPTLEDWLSKNISPGHHVGFDPWLHSYNEWNLIKTKLESNKIFFSAVSTNLVDKIWTNKPSQSGAVTPHPLKFTGKTSAEKVKEVREKLEEKKASVLVLTQLDEIAYLFNLRGCDISYNPVFFSYAIISLDKVLLFIDEAKVTEQIVKHFAEEKLSVEIHPYDKIYSFLSDIVSSLNDTKIWISQALSNYALNNLVPEKSKISTITPVQVMKAKKNPVEVNGLINAHIKDAAALCCYFDWLEKELKKGNKVTEISGATKLEEFRREHEDFVDLSFSTISSSGPHGAIIHYSPTPETDRLITTEELYLCDSGAQFRDGTTDVTRTLHFGKPTDYEKECFTRVFKGQTFLGTTSFPVKLKGNSLDVLARKFLWDVGLDYLHGTGHGIGSFLNVHEGPISIHFKVYPEAIDLEEGNFVSNEPGYYEDGKFGIRLENIVRVVPANETKYKFKKDFLKFDTVTLVPIQTKMLVPEMLTQQEVSFLNEYHSVCREKVGALLKKMNHQSALEWLYRETEPFVLSH